MVDIQGRIVLGAPITATFPNGVMFTIATDGGHHVLARTGGDPFVFISHAETLTDGASEVTTTTWRADVAAQLGEVDGIGGSGVVTPVMRIGVPGANKFIVLGQNFDTPENLYQVLGIEYGLNAAGDVDYAHKYHYFNDAGNFAPPGFLGGAFGGAVGQREIGTSVFFIADFLGGGGGEMKLAKLPTASDQVVPVSGSWDDQLFTLPGPDFNAVLWWNDVTGGAGLFEHPDGVGVLAVLDGVLWHTVVSVNAAPGTNTGQNDISADFNMPFADDGKNFAGDPTVFFDDRYVTPSINVLTDGRLEFLFIKGYSDVDGMLGVQWFVANNDLSDIQFLGFFQIDLTDVVGGGMEAAYGYRVSTTEVVWMIKEDAALTFKTTELIVPGPCASSGFDITYPPCVTSWTQCVKIQRRDGVSFRFTSLDQDIHFRGETYVTCGGLDPSATQITAQLGEVGSTELGGLIVATGVNEAELYGGLFDDAFVEIWLVPFDVADDASSGDGELPRRLAAGWAGKISHSTRGYKMEVLGPGARLDQRPIVQVYSPQCRWVFGDERCTIDIESLAIVGTVTSGINRGSIIASLGPEVSSGTGAAASSGELTAQFANGKIRWLTGVNAGQVTEVKSVDFDTGAIILWALTCFVPEIGDTFDLLPGCAQDKATCKDLYDNYLNFGGFPDVPGRDAIMESPNAKQG